MMVQPTHVRSGYVLGYSDAEQDRLIRQALLLAPITERLFRDAGIGTGQRVLDVGSGIGDVSMIAASVVGPSGEVVGVERHGDFVALARERIATVGFRNVTFIQADAHTLGSCGSFDAVVGRFVLNHCQDPVAVLRSVSRWVILGGIVAFQEVALSPALAVSECVPLWSRLLTAIHEVITRSGMSPERGLGLYRTFQEAGLPAPRMHLEMPLAGDSTIVQLQADLLRTIRSAADEHNVSLTDLGDLDTLVDRIHAEAMAANSPIAFPAIVSAWSRKTA
jgi:ubiquinone/menaquinone biosynthesis C-methylase UbiE